MLTKQLDTESLAAWNAAQDEVLHNQDDLSNWLRIECEFSKPVDTERCTRYLAMGRLTEAGLCSIAELSAVMWTDDDPAIVMAARKVLRERHLAARSCEVAKVYWQARDAEREELALSPEARFSL